MKYNPKLPDDSVNISKKNHLFEGIKLLVSFIVIAIIFFSLLKFTLYYVIDHLPYKYEIAFNQIFFDKKMIKNVKTDPYLDKVTDKIQKCAKLPYKITTYVIDQKEPNAFAVPGGKIYITRGILKMVKNENELVSILGHEMGHFKHKDHLKSLGVKALYYMISLVLKDSYGEILNPTLNLSQIKYSQSEELKADSFGIDMMQCTIKSVNSATTLFERMDKKFKSSEINYFFATHPSFKDRLKKMREYIQKKAYNVNRPVIALEKKF